MKMVVDSLYAIYPIWFLKDENGNSLAFIATRDSGIGPPTTRVDGIPK